MDPLVVAHPRDALAWHGLSGVCMLLMVATAVPGWLAGAGIAAFAAGLLWCCLRLVQRGVRAAYLRLGVCCVAMVVMLATPQHATGQATGHTTGQMTGHAMAGSGPSVVAVAVASALVAVALLAVRRPAAVPSTPRARAAGGFEAVVALAMAAMLVGVG